MLRFLQLAAVLLSIVSIISSQCSAQPALSIQPASYPATNLAETAEAALLVVCFFAVALAMPVCSFLLRLRQPSGFYSAAYIALCAGTWLVAQTGLRKVLVTGPVVWYYIEMTAVFLLPAAVCCFAVRSFGAGKRLFLRCLMNGHIIYSMAALLAAAANLISTASAIKGFFFLAGGTACFLFYVALGAVGYGSRQAGAFLLGLSCVAVTALIALLSERCGFELPVRHLTHWGLLLFVLLLVISLRASTQAASARLTANKTNRPLARQNEVRPAASQAAQDTRETSLDSMVAGLAHEINTPLGAGILAASQLEQEVEELAGLYKDGAIKRSDLERHLRSYNEIAGIILGNLRRASELIANFRAIFADRRAREELRSFNIKQYIEQVLLNLKPRIGSAGHTIRVVCADDLEIVSYPGYIAQIITNLAVNSSVHAFDPGQPGNILIEVSHQGQDLTIRYGDDGKGMEKSIVNRIFEPYYTTAVDKGGTGLGLSIVYNLVSKRLKGTIECESEVGKGTTFIIRFPAERR